MQSCRSGPFHGNGGNGGGGDDGGGAQHVTCGEGKSGPACHCPGGASTCCGAGGGGGSGCASSGIIRTTTSLLRLVLRAGQMRLGDSMLKHPEEKHPRWGMQKHPRAIAEDNANDTADTIELPLCQNGCKYTRMAGVCLCLHKSAQHV
jgi:hypothetical protein